MEKDECAKCGDTITLGETFCKRCEDTIMRAEYEKNIELSRGGKILDLRNVQLPDSNIAINRMVYTIYDKVAMECGPIFEAKNDEVAKREVRRIMEKVPSWGDYCLIKVALFDVVTGKILPISGVTFEIESLFGEVKFIVEEK